MVNEKRRPSAADNGSSSDRPRSSRGWHARTSLYARSLDAALAVLTASAVLWVLLGASPGSETVQTTHFWVRIVIAAPLIFLGYALVVRSAALFKTERQVGEAGRRLLEASQRERNLSALGRLLGGISHDFNNLLTVIRGYADVLRRRASNERDQDACLAIVDASDQASALIRQVLSFAQTRPATPTPLEVNAAIRDLVRIVDPLLGREVQLRLELSAEEQLVEIDPVQLGQVLLNLAVNARDAMPSGGVVSISTTTVNDAKQRPWVRLLVRDNGEGMDEETRARVFEPFFTTKAPGVGTGLGLATVHEIVGDSGGTIRLQSEMKRGTEFEIEWPLYQGDGRPTASTAPSLSGVPTAAPRRVTALVVEHDPLLRKLIVGILRAEGHRVLSIGDAATALDILGVEALSPGLFVASEDSWTTALAQAHRGLRDGAGLVLLSNAALDCKQNPVPEDTVHLAKPFLPGKLLESVAGALRGARRAATEDFNGGGAHGGCR